jgi:hypothetical protein
MNAEAAIQAIMANLGNPQAMAKRSELMEIPKLSGRGLAAVKKRFMLLGAAHSNSKLLQFLKRLQGGMDAEKEKNAKASADAKEAEPTTALESQYHSPTGKHTRDQCAYPASFGPSRSFGGVKDSGGGRKSKKRVHTREGLVAKLGTITIDEAIAIKTDRAILAAERGQFVVGDGVAIDNHADLLKILVLWLAENAPEVTKKAVNSIADMIDDGTIFRK